MNHAFRQLLLDRQYVVKGKEQQYWNILKRVGKRDDRRTGNIKTSF